MRRTSYQRPTTEEAEGTMKVTLNRRRWVAPIVILAAVASLVGLVPHWGFTSASKTPLWTEHPAAQTAPTPAPDWVRLSKEAKPAVVNISTKRNPEGPPMPDLKGGRPDERSSEDFFRRFFEEAPRRPVRAVGSGFILGADGYIVTNNHVVEDAIGIQVKLADGRELAAKVVGRDPKTDLALLKVDATGLPVIPLGDSSALQVGAPVMAIGNPFGLEQTVTTGIVSATGRVIGEGPYDDFIQTDASINPGHSGGPLINAQGQAVGVNTAIFSQSGGSVGISFAIPVNVAKPVVTQLAQTGRVDRGWLGVTIQPLTPELAKGLGLPTPQVALVASVADGSPAQKAGLGQGDVITEYNGRKVARSDDLPRAVAETPVGREVLLTVLRNGKPVTVTAKIAQLEEPEQKVVAQPGGEKAPLGLSVESLTPALARQLGLSESRGVIVKGVQDGSPAAEAGIQPGDVIVEADRHPVASVTELRRVVETHAKGTSLLMLVHRNGSSIYAAITLS